MSSRGGSHILLLKVERNEMKTDAKIDMLHQSGLFGKRSGARSKGRESEVTDEIEEEVELSMSTVSQE